MDGGCLHRRLIEADEVVGIDWGRPLSAMVEHLPAFRAVTVAQIAGGALTPSDVAALGVAGVVAHSFPMFFTADGRIVSGGTREHAIGITVDKLQAVARRISIADGHSKAVALEAVPHPGLFTQPVTDVAAAKALVSGRS